MDGTLLLNCIIGFRSYTFYYSWRCDFGGMIGTVIWYNIDAQFYESIEFSGAWLVRNVCIYICILLAFKITSLYVDDKECFFVSRPCLTSVSELLILIFIFLLLASQPCLG
jgi:hypothetical protein